MYATQQDLINRYGEDELLRLTDRTGAGVVDAAVVEQALSDAAAQVDGYLAGRYRLPLATVPKVLTFLACDLARYSLYADVAPEHVTKRRDDAAKFLAAVGRGELSLGVSDQGETAAPADGAEMVTDGRTFSRRDKSFL